MISAATISLLVDAGLSGQLLKDITAAIESDVVVAINLLREHERNSVTASDAGSVTPAALRMRKMREKQRLSDKSEGVTERNAVTEQGVTSDNNITSLEVVVKKERVVGNVTRKRNSYAPLFETFWTAYPGDKGMSKVEASKEWAKLCDEEQQQAVAALPEFKEWVKGQGTSYRVVHACRYLSQRRFEGFKATERAGQCWTVKRGDADHAAWMDYYRASGRRMAFYESRDSFTVPSQFPPTLQKEKAA